MAKNGIVQFISVYLFLYVVSYVLLTDIVCNSWNKVWDSSYLYLYSQRIYRWHCE